MEKEKLFKEIVSALVDMEIEKAADLARRTLEINIPAYETITHALIPGMDEVNRLFEEEEYFLPEVLLCSDAFNAALDVVKPYLDKSALETPIKVVIGVVEGDTHYIGKNLVRILMESSGFEVYDLGRDVPLDRFIEKAEEVNSTCLVLRLTWETKGLNRG